MITRTRKVGRIHAPRGSLWHVGPVPPEQHVTEDGEPVYWYNNNNIFVYSEEHQEWLLLTDVPEFDPYQLAVVYGGVDSSGAVLRSCSIISFKSDELSFVRGPLGISSPLTRAAAFASALDGYSGADNTWESVSFATQTVSQVVTSPLAQESVGFNSREAGYSLGGSTGSVLTNKINKLSFSDASTKLVSVMSTSTRRACGFNSADQGFYLGGCSENVQTLYENVNTLTFALDNQKALTTRLLAEPTRDSASFNSREQGYVVGGASKVAAETNSVYACSFKEDNHRVIKQSTITSPVSRSCGFNSRGFGYVMRNAGEVVRVSFSADASLSSQSVSVASLVHNQDASCCDSTDNNNFIFNR